MILPSTPPGCTPRIAHVISTPSGVAGAERVVGSLIAHGRERGSDQLLLNPFARDSEHAAIRQLCAPVEYRGFSSTTLRGVPGLAGRLATEIRRWRPDLVHVHLFHAEVLMAALRPLIRAPLILTHHHGDDLLRQQRRVAARADRWAGRRFDRVVAVSGWVSAFLVHGYGYPASKVTLIPNGWIGQPVPRPDQPSQPTVICIANFREQKGHRTLLSAFVRVRDSLPNARLLLIGEGGLERSLRNYAAALGIADAVKFRGWVEDVWPLLAKSDVFALPSRWEPAGIAVMEAMAAGLPVVASRVGGLVELIDDRRTGFLITPDDPDALARRLVSLLGSRDERERIGREARRRVDSLRMDVTVARYWGLYESLLG